MPEKTVCHCFGYTEDAIANEVRRHGRSLIMARIVADKKAGRCECHEKNPSGR
ncbi:MAG: BFD-like (2Fe-2S) protein [Deltaproteobacteria bacterium RIFOXYD12_FULL_57_12]|nr:MAG: BFD-like (2Fe-2S) protein [Deltaproteobacteria bacterium RIFOXYD12_FULL_57_12]